MVKLVFVDMDDTFLTSAKEISAENLRALDLAYEKGVQFVPCTGRNITGIPAALVEHPCVNYAICCSGTLIRDVRTGELLHEVDVDKGLALDLYQRVCDLDITYDAFADGTIYALADRWHVLDEIVLDEATRAMVKSLRTTWEGSFGDLLQHCGEICRLNVFYKDDAARDAVFAQVDAESSLRRTSSLPCNIEITPADGHKGSALLWLCDYLDVDTADTVAFGDSDNDLTMIEAAGDGVAMANALPQVKAVADHIAASCDESGVGRYVTELLSR